MTPLQSSSTTIIPAFETAKVRPLDTPTTDFESQTNVEGREVTVPTVILQEAGVEGADKITTPTSIYTVPGGAFVRRPDSDTKNNRYRLVEVAGSPHGAGSNPDCDGNGSTFPTNLFYRASAANLARWARRAPRRPSAARVKVTGTGKVTVAETDEHGNALGGVRSPYLDVPLAKYEAHSTGAPTCGQIGNETPLPAETLQQLYGDGQTYMTKFTKALGSAIKKRDLLQQDRQEILDAQQAKADAAFGPG